ncbi:MAG TPA: hypothetical protein VFN26_16340 [Candidatus Acidoferrum sp.]|nr:hypothetical protein [Candidatus Acidoferrum sp.]
MASGHGDLHVEVASGRWQALSEDTDHPSVKKILGGPSLRRLHLCAIPLFSGMNGGAGFG